MLAAAVTAWALTTGSDVGADVLRAYAINPLFGFPAERPDWGQIGGIVILYAIFGLPPAILVCFAAGRWAWSWADARHLHTARHAVQVGLKTGAIVGFLSLAATTANEMFGDNGFDYYHWYPTLPVVKDSSLTPFGWALEIGEFGITTLTGAASGLAAWWVASLTDPALRGPRVQTSA